MPILKVMNSEFLMFYLNFTLSQPRMYKKNLSPSPYKIPKHIFGGTRKQHIYRGLQITMLRKKKNSSTVVPNK